mgnify:CR=1 FL=1
MPEITDTSKWYQGKHHYSDPENQYIFDYVATATYGAISYNTKLVNVKDFKSYWDLLAPKWKGKIISRDVRVSGPGSGNARLFYHLPDVGPTFIQEIIRRDGRDAVSRLSPGSATGLLWARRRFVSLRSRCVETARACPWIPLALASFKEGAGLVSQYGTLGIGQPRASP